MGSMLPPHMRRPLPGPGVMHSDMYGPGMHPPQYSAFPHSDLPPLEVLEQKLAAQRMEMQVLQTENRRLAATHGTLRHELAAAQNELQMFQSKLDAVRAEKEQQIRNLTERVDRLSSELQAEEAVRADLEKARSEAQKLALARQELMSKVKKLTHEHQRVHADVQKVPFLVQELESVRQEFQHCRSTYDHEKKLYNDHLQSLQVMEKDYYNMAKEVEKLRAELNASANINRRPGGAYGSKTGYSETDVSANHPAGAGQTSYEDSYTAQHGRGAHPVATGVSGPPAAAPSYYDSQLGLSSQWPGYGGGSFYDQPRNPYDPQMQIGMYNHPQAAHYNPHQVPPRLHNPPHTHPAANAPNNTYSAASVALPPAQPRPGNPVL